MDEIKNEEVSQNPAPDAPSSAEVPSEIKEEVSQPSQPILPVEEAPIN